MHSFCIATWYASITDTPLEIFVVFLRHLATNHSWSVEGSCCMQGGGGYPCTTIQTDADAWNAWKVRGMRLF